MVKPKRAKIAHASTENASEKDDPESSTQATDKEQPVSKPNASTQPEETNPVKDVRPATNATDAVVDYGEINVRKLPEQIFSSIKIERSRKTKKSYQRSNGQLVKTDELDRPRDSARPFAEWDKSSSANGRAGSTTDSAWPFAELD
ncbi:hypothetical protein F2Q70_00017102 [Brassica cretica]|uniref:Uncharacterized protein n=1 Tax=Brassica cretica TaxID=69181 RepID=A0A8S9HY35_BRACR|nr:hypothetical protein F2Q70_00017102 [Brassica cretica]